MHFNVEFGIILSLKYRSNIMSVCCCNHILVSAGLCCIHGVVCSYTAARCLVNPKIQSCYSVHKCRPISRHRVKRKSQRPVGSTILVWPSAKLRGLCASYTHASDSRDKKVGTAIQLPVFPISELVHSGMLGDELRSPAIGKCHEVLWLCQVCPWSSVLVLTVHISFRWAGKYDILAARRAFSKILSHWGFGMTLSAVRTYILGYRDLVLTICDKDTTVHVYRIIYSHYIVRRSHGQASQPLKRYLQSAFDSRENFGPRRFR